MVNFEQDVLAQSHTMPVLVDFWAEWCGPCRTLGPVLDRLAAEPGARFRLVKINTDEQQDIAARYRISSIPAVKLFADGKVAAEFVGALPEREVRRWLETHLPRASQKLVAEAKAATAAGDDALAMQKLEDAVKSDERAYEARVLLAAALFSRAPGRAQTLIDAIPANDEAAERADALRALLTLVERAQTGVGEQTPAADWQAYFDGALHVAEGRYREALETWIALVKKSRKLDDDGVRKAVVALFTMLGDVHPLTQEFRRPFSLALY